MLSRTSSFREFHRALHRWYQKHGRHDLPWRNTPDPYAIYVSEVMLQQTQVETVRTRFYPQFLQRFPSLKALARADAEEVLAAWQGLGYYSRARHLHQAAQQCKAVLPKTVEGLMGLPGIGRNTAHAIAAFAYREPLAVMEANVKRILCRIFAIKTPSEKELWEKAALLLNAADPFDYNQAMMDLGAMICTVADPQCASCPAAGICQGKKTPDAFPEKKRKKAVPVRHRHIIVKLDADGKIEATPRSSRFLHGMYHFTEEEQRPEPPATHIGSIEQKYSHFTLKAELYLLSSPRRRGSNRYYSLEELHALPMSMAEKKILRILMGNAEKNEARAEELVKKNQINTMI